MYHELYPVDQREYLRRTGLSSNAKEVYAVSNMAFIRQMKLIKHYGLDVRLMTNTSEQEIDNVVYITFDDGGRSAFEIAAPILAEYGFKGHFFVCTGMIGTSNFCSREDLVKMRNLGHIIGSHTCSHPNLTLLDDDRLKEELCDSKSYLEELLNEECTHFCLPGGQFNERVRLAIQNAGYKVVHTSVPSTHVFCRNGAYVNRWPIRESMSFQNFQRLITLNPRYVLLEIMRYKALQGASNFLGYNLYSLLRQQLMKQGKAFEGA